MSGIKNTTFLEAITAAIQHEKDFFDFCMKTYEELNEGLIKDFFFDLAEDSDEHIKLIQQLYSQVLGGEPLPNLKYLGEVYKFQATSIQKLMRRLDRNKKLSANGNEMEALRLAQQEADDAIYIFEVLSQKFNDPGIRALFRQMAAFNRERSAMLEGCMVFYHPTAEKNDDLAYYANTDLMNP